MSWQVVVPARTHLAVVHDTKGYRGFSRSLCCSDVRGYVPVMVETEVNVSYTCRDIYSRGCAYETMPYASAPCAKSGEPRENFLVWNPDWRVYNFQLNLSFRNKHRVGGSCVLASGRPTPNSNFHRGEVVCLALQGRGRTAFEDGGCRWAPVSSRLLWSKLKIVHSTKNNNGCTWLTVVVCNAPTFRAPASQKENFFQDLQDIILSVPADQSLVLLGDFNARVGSGQWPGL